MNKKTLLTLALYLYGITTQVNAESITENTTENVVSATPAEQPAEREQLVLAWEERSALRLLKNLHNNNQLNIKCLQSFVGSPHNHLNKNAASIKELNLCAVLEKQKQILTREINDITIKRVYNGNYPLTKWLKLLYSGWIITVASLAANEVCTINNNRYLNTINRTTSILEPFSKKPIENCNEIAKQLVEEISSVSVPSPAIFIAGAFGGAAYFSYRAYKLYEYYTCISSKEKEIKLLDAMIATIQEIEQSE